MKKESWQIGGGYLLICLIWGSTWLAIRAGLESLTPFISSGIRFLMASIFIWIFMHLRKIKIQKDKKSIRLYVFLGFFSFVIPFGLVYWAEQYIASGLASILFAVYPLLVLVFSKFAIKESEIGVYQTIGVLLGFAGLIIIFSAGISFNIDYNFWAMLAVFSSATLQAGVAVVIKKYGGHLNPLSMNFIPVLIAGISLTGLALFTEDISSWRFTNEAFLSLVYLAFFGTVLTFTTFYWLLQRMNVVILSLSSFISPIIAVILGWLILNETLTLRDLLGSSFVLIGILFANFKGLKNYYLLKLASKNDKYSEN